ncbi:MAG: SRPBCC family protein [Anaerolineales bacterium]|nr:SRPBCC family protein [Anaerolineales bacterium]
MSEPTFTTEIYVDRAPEHVLEFLSDLSRHDRIHPLIVSVEELNTPEEQFRRYRITDRIPFGPFMLKAVYEADIWRTQDGDLRSIARQSPGIVLHNLTRAIPKGDGTLLREEVSVKAPRLLLNFVIRQAEESHEKMFTRIKEALEAE